MADAILDTQAVFDAFPDEPALKTLADLTVSAKFVLGELTVTVARENIVAACEALKQASYIFFEDFTAVDWYPSEPRFQLCYSLLSFSLKRRIRLVVRLTSNDATISSVTDVWPAANFYER